MYLAIAACKYIIKKVNQFCKRCINLTKSSVYNFNWRTIDSMLILQFFSLPFKCTYFICYNNIFDYHVDLKCLFDYSYD